MNDPIGKAYMNTRTWTGFAVNELPVYDKDRLNELVIKYLRGKVTDLEQEVEYWKSFSNNVPLKAP